MDCSELLIRQLVEIASLGRQLRQLAGRPARRSLHREVCNRAALHVLARERFLLPAWHRAGWKSPGADRLQAYAEFKQRLAQLLVTDPDRPGYAGALDSFLQSVEAQRHEDEKIVVPTIRRTLHLSERRTVFDEIERFYEMSAPAASTALEGVEPAGHELVQEASIVLSSLPSPSARGGASASGFDGPSASN